MANIFKRSVVKQKIEQLHITNFDKKLAIIQKWYDAYKDTSLHKKTETQCEQAFNDDIFKKVLGYTEFPTQPHTLIPQLVPEKSGQRVDATLGWFDGKTQRVFGVVEIKDVNKPLDRSQQREGNLSPIQQAFKYKPLFKDCRFVIATNFFELRLFQDNQLDYEQFTLKSLCDPTNDYFELKKFILLLSAENFVSGRGKSKTEDLLAEIRIEQEKITQKFYNVYSQLRLDLMRDIWKNNKSKRNIHLVADKSQKLLDRIVFASFCEDSGLLPDNTLHKVYAHSEASFSSVWDTLKGFFRAVDSGSEKLGIPDGYNGGLFHEDADLDSLKISDSVLKSLSKISTYDFENELSVNVLGHVFEQSISDLEEIKKKVKPEDVSNKSKQKKDGIFYTPEYIVEYIVENSLGRYLRENEEKIFNENNLSKAKTEKTYRARELKALQDYQKFLHNVKVVDPACGSGAFLVKVFDYLLNENKRIGEQIGGLFDQDQIYRDILKNNIFGVDLNEESIRITQLSLWLKTAQKGKKLTYLDKNIKVGNSIVDNPKVAGKKAFNWHNEFQDVFEQGGFDIVLGNPPYIKEATNKEAFEGLHSDPIYQGKMDLWYFFGNLAINIVKDESGIISYIAPNNWITNDGASKFRNQLIENTKILEFIDFGDYKVFDNAGIQTMIYFLKKTKNNMSYTMHYSKLLNNKVDDDEIKSFLRQSNNQKFTFFKTLITKKSLFNKIITFVDPSLNIILERIRSKRNFAFKNNEISSGIDILQDFVNKKHKTLIKDIEVGTGIFNLTNEEIKKIGISTVERKIIKPFYTPKEALRYFTDKKNKFWVIYTDSSFKDPEKINEFPNIKKHLDKFKPLMTSVNKPYGLHRSRDEKNFKGEKILSLRKCSDRPIFSFADFDTYVNRSFLIIKTERANLKYLTAILNSNIMTFWLKFKGKMQGNNYQIDKNPLLDLPIVVDNHTVQDLNDLVTTIIDIRQKIIDYKNLLSVAQNNNQYEDVINLTKIIDDFDNSVKTQEDKINEIVYKIYGIQRNDQIIIENNI